MIYCGRFVSCRTRSSRNQRSSAAAEQTQGALLLEVEGAAGGGRDAPEATAEIRYGCPHRRFGQHPQPEGQGRRADVIPPLELQRGGDRLQISLTELPVRRPVSRPPLGRPPGRQDPADWVLKDFSAAERKELDLHLERAADAVEALVADGLAAAQNVYND